MEKRKWEGMILFFPVVAKIFTAFVNGYAFGKKHNVLRIFKFLFSFSAIFNLAIAINIINCGIAIKTFRGVPC